MSQCFKDFRKSTHIVVNMVVHTSTWTPLIQGTGERPGSAPLSIG